MKGGGIVIVFFLFICFVWGIASVVGSIRTAVKRPGARQRPGPSESLTTQAGALPAVAANLLCEKPASDVHKIIASLRQIQELHDSGTISEAEFARIKALLLQQVQPEPNHRGACA